MSQVARLRYREDIIRKLVARGYPRDVLARNPHLVEYVLQQKTIPEFQTAPKDELKYAERFNIIYPIGDPLFINAIAYSSTIKKYIAIEPKLPSREIMDLVEEAFSLEAGNYDPPQTQEEKAELIQKILKKILVPVDGNGNGARLRKGRVYIPRQYYDTIFYYMLRDKVGGDVLEPFLRDPYIEDVSAPGVGCIYIVHKIFGAMETSICFSTTEELDEFVIRLSERIGKPVSTSKPIVDATLPDGSRINIVYGRDVSQKGSNFTIRKFSPEPISIIKLIKWGTMSYQIAAYLWMALREQMSIWVCGETASGKTTTLNAMAVFIPPEYKIVSIEDTPEVNIPHENWVRETTRDTGSAESSVTLFDLLRAALRQRPNYIIVGEIRGKEGNVAFQAMQSVSWDTPVMIRNTLTGEVHFKPIGEFIDQFYRDREENTPKYIYNFQVLTLDKRGNLKWADIRYVLRHRARKIYRVIYDGGGEVRATGSHSVFVLDTDAMEIRPKEVSNLKPGDLLVSFIKAKPEPRIYLELARYRFSRRTVDREQMIPYLLWLNRIAGYNSELNQIKNRKTGMVSYELVKTNPSRGLRELATILYGELLEIANRYGLPEAVFQSLDSVYIDIERETITREKILDAVRRMERYRSQFSERDRERIERIKTIAGSDIVVARVREVRIEPYSGYVYDISVPETELFLGGEVPIALHNTGHPVLATFHAANLQRLVQRLTGSPIDIPVTFIDNLNIVIFQNAVYDKRGKLMRRVLEIDEIFGWDATNERVIFIPVFTWDPGADKHIYSGMGSSFILENKIALRRGIPRSQIRKIYDELEMRAKYLRLLAERGIDRYRDVWKAIKLTYEEDLETLIRKLERGEKIV